MQAFYRIGALKEKMLAQLAERERIGMHRRRSDIRARESPFEAAPMAMCRILSVFVGWLIAAGVFSAQADAQPPLSRTQTDSAGDPLPAGAIARLGVTRFRHGGWNAGMTISPDSTTVVSTSETGNVRFWDIATGKLLHE